jgi:hypothetical protein
VLRGRNANSRQRSYNPESGPIRIRSGGLGWGIAVQTARPRDVGALLFVIGLFLSLFLVTLLVPGH